MNLKPSRPTLCTSRSPTKTRAAFQKSLDALYKRIYYECVLYYKHTCAWVDTCLADLRKILLSTPDSSSCERKSFNGYSRYYFFLFTRRLCDSRKKPKYKTKKPQRNNKSKNRHANAPSRGGRIRFKWFTRMRIRRSKLKLVCRMHSAKIVHILF